MDPRIGDKLLQTPGWQTLMTILKESGGSPSQRLISAKRPIDGSGGGGYDWKRAERRWTDAIDNERLTKRLRGVSLKDKFSIRR